MKTTKIFGNSLPYSTLNLQQSSVLMIYAAQEKINISASMNDIPYINGAREMGVRERIASVT